MAGCVFWAKQVIPVAKIVNSITKGLMFIFFDFMKKKKLLKQFLKSQVVKQILVQVDWSVLNWYKLTRLEILNFQKTTAEDITHAAGKMV